MTKSNRWLVYSDSRAGNFDVFIKMLYTEEPEATAPKGKADILSCGVCCDVPRSRTARLPVPVMFRVFTTLHHTTLDTGQTFFQLTEHRDHRPQPHCQQDHAQPHFETTQDSSTTRARSKRHASDALPPT